MQQTYFFLAHLGPYWNDIWFLLNLVPISDWLLYQQALIMLLCWQQICAFRLLLFWYKIPPVFGCQLETFHSSSVMRSLTVWHFSYEYLQEFLGYESLFWKYIDLFALHISFLGITSFIEMIQALIFRIFCVNLSLMKDFIGV